MHDDRCPNCDRVIAAADNADEGMCEVELSFNSRRRTSDWNRSARRACDDHAVDWRARALAAEAALVELTERAASSGAPTPDHRQIPTHRRMIATVLRCDFATL